jgi:alkyldihydroxyacetonephosphate synthase
MRRAAAPMATGLGAQAAHADPTGAALDLFVTAQAEPNEPEAASALYRRLDDAVVAAALEAGAETVAHHYGVGRTRRAGWKRERGPEHVAALRALKSALDPNGVLPSL